MDQIGPWTKPIGKFGDHGPNPVGDSGSVDYSERHKTPSLRIVHGPNDPDFFETGDAARELGIFCSAGPIWPWTKVRAQNFRTRTKVRAQNRPRTKFLFQERSTTVCTTSTP